MEAWRPKMESWRLRMESWRVYRPVVADSHTLMRRRIRIRIRVKKWIRIRIKSRKSERLKKEPWRAVEAHNGGLETQNGVLDGL